MPEKFLQIRKRTDSFFPFQDANLPCGKKHFRLFACAKLLIAFSYLFLAFSESAKSRGLAIVIIGAIEIKNINMALSMEISQTIIFRL